MADENRWGAFGARAEIDTTCGKLGIYRLRRLEELGLTRLDRLPFSIRVLLESVLRHCDGYTVTEEDVRGLADWAAKRGRDGEEIPFKPARVLLQDFTGVPAIVDLAAMRSAVARLGGDPKRINPLIPADLVIDHSVQVDFFGDADALRRNVELEFRRNRERYEFLRWGQESFDNLRVVPPSVGIIHQVNLEYLARCVFVGKDAIGDVAYPDTLVGTDSHTTMINALGVLGWGVGGIEAEAAMLGQPLSLPAPEVIAVELTGTLRPGVTATDLVLSVTELLRREGVVGKFVEYCGDGAERMPVADRAVLANMAPEYGATMGFFPIDARTLEYLLQTGRSESHVAMVERYCKEQGLFRDANAPAPDYTKLLRFDLAAVEPCLAGPKRPQDRVPLREVRSRFRDALTQPAQSRGFGLAASQVERKVAVALNGSQHELRHGAVVLAAITSCTNTSNPTLMVMAGILAKKALARGLRVPAYVKTSLAPGSRAVNRYLAAAGLEDALAALGFATVGYGCTTCIGNSGPLPEPVAQAVREGELVAAAVLSGNRNFEGRINPLVKANYLASPPLVVAFALAGTVDIDLTREPLGKDAAGQEIYLRDVWPGEEETAAVLRDAMSPEVFRRCYAEVFSGNSAWNALPLKKSELFDWCEESTYIHEPPFFADLTPEPRPPEPIRDARVLLALGDSVTTDHISPAGNIAKDSPAGRFLISRGVPPEEFNSYGARRGNDQVMVRGTFANIRLRNLLVPGTEGGVTKFFPTGEILSVYEAAVRYQELRVPTVILAGAEYGTGSSRDWAAKGTAMLGIRAVLAQSFERIHRSNLVGMGVLPLQFADGATWQSLGLQGDETFHIPLSVDELRPRREITIEVASPEKGTIRFPVRIRIDTPVEVEYYRNGGILPMVIRKLLS
ncbi:MAG: aconitate hydratase AcnA [Thermogutta sp.]